MSNRSDNTARNSATATRSALSRQCPECGRKSAMVWHSDEFCFGHACRWCGHERMTTRAALGASEGGDQT